jgi:hypothetical protein
MNKFVVAAASAALLAGTALANAQETQGSGSAQEEIIKKPDAGSATKAAPNQQQQEQTGQTEEQPATGEQQQQTGQTEQKPAAGEQEQKTGEADQQKPSNETTASVDISTEQKTEITQVFRSEKAEPVDIDIDVNVGVVVPRTVTLRPLPPRVIEIVPAYSSYEYFVLADGRIVIVEPGTFKVVYILVV